MSRESTISTYMLIADATTERLEAKRKAELLKSENDVVEALMVERPDLPEAEIRAIVQKNIANWLANGSF